MKSATPGPPTHRDDLALLKDRPQPVYGAKRRPTRLDRAKRGAHDARVTVNFDAQTYGKLTDMADQHRVSTSSLVAGVVRRYLTDYVRSLEKPGPANEWEITAYDRARAPK